MEIKKGFTLIELMIVVAIIAFLSFIAVPSFLRYLSKAKRVEAYMNLNSLYMAQKAYYAEHGKYSTQLSGQGGLGWQPEGNTNYSYGFPGGEGQTYFTGKLGASMGDIGQGFANDQGFVAVAAGDIDGDGKADVLTVDQNNNIKIVVDDLN